MEAAKTINRKEAIRYGLWPRQWATETNIQSREEIFKSCAV